MGKQICFYGTQIDVNNIIDIIHQKNGVVIDGTGTVLSKTELNSIADWYYSESHFGGNKFYITKQEFLPYHHTKTTKKSIKEFPFEVIEFSLCTPSPAKVLDTSYVDARFTKEGFVVIDDSDEYHRLMNELMENPIYVCNPNYVENGFEHGRLWYSASCFDSNESIKNHKEVCGLYNSLSRYIRDHFKQTKDKFAYIGMDAYELYHQGRFIPCSGRNSIIVE